MGKETGIAITTLSVDDSGGTARAIKNDIGAFSINTPRPQFDVTGLDKSAIERLLGLADFAINLNLFFNDATNQEHDVFKTVPSTSVARTTTLTVSGQTLANEALFTDYGWNRGADGNLALTAPGVLADGTVPTWA